MKTSFQTDKKKHSHIATCQQCHKLDGKKYPQCVAICGRCREILKADLAIEVRHLDRVYLSEFNRNRTGRPDSLTIKAKRDIKIRYKNGESMRKLAESYGVSVGKIHKTVHSK